MADDPLPHYGNVWPGDILGRLQDLEAASNATAETLATIDTPNLSSDTGNDKVIGEANFTKMQTSHPYPDSTLYSAGASGAGPVMDALIQLVSLDETLERVSIPRGHNKMKARLVCRLSVTVSGNSMYAQIYEHVVTGGSPSNVYQLVGQPLVGTAVFAPTSIQDTGWLDLPVTNLHSDKDSIVGIVVWTTDTAQAFLSDGTLRVAVQ